MQESAIAMFIGAPPSGLGPLPFHYRGASIYASTAEVDSGGERVWEVRTPRADLIVLPLTTVERMSGVEIRADVLIRYEHRSCEQPLLEPATWRCQGWQETTCCNRIWVWRHGTGISRPAN
jgi:hypothetical protein